MKKLGNFFAVLCLLLVASCSGAPSGRALNAGILVTVETLDLEKYLGKWYEIARYPNRFERGCTNVTAEYGLLSETRISVVNTCQVGNNTKIAKGKASILDGSNGTRLAVNFAPFPLPVGAGNYYILYIGGDYETALVGEPSGKYLWLLARSKVINSTQRSELERAALRNGYNLQMLENVVHDRN